MYINSSYATHIGTQHVIEGKQCQDVVVAKKWDDYCAIALADGAGSEAHSLIGAQTVAETTIRELKRNCNSWIDFANPETIKYTILEECLKALAFNPYDICEQASTLIFAIVKSDGHFLYGHIGDGIIIKIDKNGQNLISKPENGEYINETEFVTSNMAYDHFRIGTGSLEKNDCLLLCSDGLSPSLYSVESGKFASALGLIRNWAINFSEEDFRDILNDNLEHVFSQLTYDDMSIGVISLHEYEKGELQCG